MIDEKKLIEDIHKHFCQKIEASGGDFMSDADLELLKMNKDICGIIKAQPTIEQYGTWIPCSERLPEEPEENPEFDGRRLELYLVSVNDEEYPFRAFWNGKSFTDGAFKVNAVAWMPLPLPYREEKKDE